MMKLARSVIVWNKETKSHERINVVVTIDPDSVANQLGRAAYASKRGKSAALHGAVRCERVTHR
ncbi:hypothetical protein [Rhizobium phage RHph_X2_24]|nr:hypothetical protein [Rhizobium phage RHph_X2_24]